MEQVAAIYNASQQCAVMQEEFLHFFQPIQLNSPNAQLMRDQHIQMQQWEQRRRPALLEPSPSERIDLLLRECELGNTEAWWQLNRAMTLEPQSSHYGSDLESDLTALPGWRDADGNTRTRLVNAAEHYIYGQDPHTDTWLGTNTLYRPAFAGYRAFRLLQSEASNSLDILPSHVWQTWASIIVAYPSPYGTGDEIPHQHLVARAYRQSPNAVIKALSSVIDQESRQSANVFVTRKFELCWDDRLVMVLLDKAMDPYLPFAVMGALLSDLLRRDFLPARTFAESLITTQNRLDCGYFGRAIVAAQILLQFAPDAGWAVVWPAIQHDPHFGRRVVLGAAHKPIYEAASIGRRLGEQDIANLYIWLVRQFPPKQDPSLEGGRFLGPRDTVAQWRDTLVQQLVNRGTIEACHALRTVMSDLPGLVGLHRLLIEAEGQTRYRTWKPFPPERILDLARRHESRLVQNGEQLLDAIVESLRRLESKFQGETPLNFVLWNEQGGRGAKTHQPKDEERFSDFVKHHLQDDLVDRGVVLNREVVIRSGSGSGGERTDIHVDAVIHQHDQNMFDRVTVIIEVKGCWHREVKTAMQGQLVNRYLKNNTCNHGLYLVGWYLCERWDPADYRKSDVPFVSIEEAKTFLTKQGKALSADGLLIQSFVIDTSLH